MSPLSMTLEHTPASTAFTRSRATWRHWGGQIPEHPYEIIDPKVQVYGGLGILTLRYHPFSLDGEPLTPWKATTVYRHTNGEWCLVHAHWSMVKEAGE